MERVSPALHAENEKLSADLDYYKLTMGQLAFEKYKDAEVTFTLKNRSAEHLLGEYVNLPELQARFEDIRDYGFQPEEIAYFASLQAENGTARFTPEYLDYLADLKLAQVNTVLDWKGELRIDTTGPWVASSLWETVVMSEVNEQYYKNYLAEKGLSREQVWKIGDEKLDEKIARLAERPDIKFADFGTRRRFSRDWQEHVIGRLATELPDNFVGTSNPWFAYKFGLKPIGTYAHEMPMVYAALADAEEKSPLSGHQQMLEDWHDRYGADLSTALTDTFTSDYFFANFTDEEARDWRGLRHDSGDPIEFGERVISFYKERYINPLEKTIVFSDGLDINMIEKLADHFGGRIKLLFGWGTSLMNDLGVRANNFVMKATEVNGTETVKLSDDEGKHTGSQAQVARYIMHKNVNLQLRESERDGSAYVYL